MKIYINRHFENEKKYIINVLFKEFLGLTFDILLHDKLNYRIVLENGNCLQIEDAFFSRSRENEYINLSNIPSEIIYMQNSFTKEDNIPVIYGRGIINKESNFINCGIDIFASSFFMLSRWEEVVISEKDKHNRILSDKTLAGKWGFLNRPVVNEYLEMLWSMLLRLGIGQSRKIYNYQIVVTHDVDMPRRYPTWVSGIRTMLGDVYKRKSFTDLSFTFNSLFMTKFGFSKDPCDTFDEIMNLSEKNNTQSHFYFMSGGVTRFDNYYQIKSGFIRDLIERIDKRGHIIGFHPSYNAYNDSKQFQKELNLLRELSPQPIKYGRQHFLRFDVPLTWQIWEDNGLLVDSTLGYADKEGFRCGTCYPFPVFNVITRKQLKLMENPLHVMEGSLGFYQNLTVKDFQENLASMINTIKRYQGNFVLLWHNSALNTPEWSKYRNIYTKTINENSNNSRSETSIY